MTSMHLIAHWNPEDAAFWRGPGRRVARRNLALSVPALMLAFAVWMLWSVVVVHLPAAGFRFSTNQLFWLAALPALSGATLRVFYAFAVPVFGGRRWTALATASLLLPALGTGFALQDTTTPYEVLVGLALLCGLGGGNFASSMAHISYFYPRHRAGWALGLNAGLGNLGVSLAQALVPAVIAFSLLGAFGAPTNAALAGAAGTAPATPVVPITPIWLQNAGFVWVPLIAASCLAAWFGMNDLADVRSGFGEQAVIFKRKHTWLSCWLYLGTFGSFIGFAAGFPLLLASHFPAVDATQLAWIGPLVGAVLRPLGGWLSDRLGGARVTLWCLAAMALSTLGVWQWLPGEGAAEAGHLPGVLAGFVVLFAAAGIGSSSVFRMIPLIFAHLHEGAPGAADSAPKNSPDRASDRAADRATVPAEDAGAKRAHTEAAATLGFCSAIGAYGGFVIPKSFGTALLWSGSAAPALLMFIAFYLSCIAITWWHYGRPGAALPC
ncbi:MAG: MFS transporter [Burkholderiales bacterium]|nr:MFS transporter [Burkholderiales bacterium]